MTNSPIPMNALARRYAAVQHYIENAVLDTMRSGWWLNGPETNKFAASFALMTGNSHCLPVANGTDALELALRSVKDTKHVDCCEVITVANAGGYATVACRQVGLKPVYVDIDEASQLMDLSSVISALNPSTAAIIVTHLYGGAVNVPALRSAMPSAFADVAIIEDCAQAHGAVVGEHVVGSLGDIATFSFYPTKNLGAIGDGGAIVTSSEIYARSVRSLHQYGWSAKYQITSQNGRNSRMDEVQAAVLSALLPLLPAWNARRCSILERYRQSAGGDVRFVDGGPGSVAHLAVALSDARDELRSFMQTRNISTEIHYPILDCDQSAWRHLPVGIAATGLPNSRRSVDRIVTLPCFPEMTESEVDRVAEALQQWRI